MVVPPGLANRIGGLSPVFPKESPHDHRHSPPPRGRHRHQSIAPERFRTTESPHQLTPSHLTDGVDRPLGARNGTVRTNGANATRPLTPTVRHRRGGPMRLMHPNAPPAGPLRTVTDGPVVSEYWGVCDSTMAQVRVAGPSLAPGRRFLGFLVARRTSWKHFHQPMKWVLNQFYGVDWQVLLLFECAGTVSHPDSHKDTFKGGPISLVCITITKPSDFFPPSFIIICLASTHLAIEKGNHKMESPPKTPPSCLQLLFVEGSLSGDTIGPWSAHKGLLAPNPLPPPLRPSGRPGRGPAPGRRLRQRPHPPPAEGPRHRRPRLAVPGR